MAARDLSDDDGLGELAWPPKSRGSGHALLRHGSSRRRRSAGGALFSPADDSPGAQQAGRDRSMGIGEVDSDSDGETPLTSRSHAMFSLDSSPFAARSPQHVEMTVTPQTPPPTMARGRRASVAEVFYVMEEGLEPDGQSSGRPVMLSPPLVRDIGTSSDMEF
jgi:hypothetical protein